MLRDGKSGPSQRTHKINCVDTSCCGCCFHLDCWSLLDFICSLRWFSQLCTPRQVSVISETFFFFFSGWISKHQEVTRPEKKKRLCFEVKRREEPPSTADFTPAASQGSFHSSLKCSTWLPSRPFQHLQPSVALNINTATSCAWTGGGRWWNCWAFCASGAAK